MADVYAVLGLHEDGKLRTIQADTADACILAVGHSQEALGVVAQSFWLGEQGVGPPAILEASRMAALPCQLLQPICMCSHKLGLPPPAGMGSIAIEVWVRAPMQGRASM